MTNRKYVLTLDQSTDLARFETETVEVAIRLSDNKPLSWKPKSAKPEQRLDMLPYLKLKLLAESLADPRHVNFANITS